MLFYWIDIQVIIILVEKIGIKHQHIKNTDQTESNRRKKNDQEAEFESFTKTELATILFVAIVFECKEHQANGEQDAGPPDHFPHCEILIAHAHYEPGKRKNTKDH